MSSAITHTAASGRKRALHIGLWVLQGLLAVVYLWHGWMFVAPPAELVPILDASIPPALRVFIGVAELLAAAGLILPGATRVMPSLTVAAAAGLMLVMASAAVFHLLRGETASAVSAVVLLILITLTAALRRSVAPIAPRRRA